MRGEVKLVRMTDSFNPSQYGAAFAEAIGAEPVMQLDAGRPDGTMRRVLDALAAKAEAERTIVDRDAFACCLAAVWLLHGYLDEAHALCQDVPTPSGSYWHGVMHRREGDYGNAQYWFRRAGAHPACGTIAADWDPIAFVDEVRRAVKQGGANANTCVQRQRDEWRAFFDWCWREAIA
jgi:hypothetical protein